MVRPLTISLAVAAVWLGTGPAHADCGDGVLDGDELCDLGSANGPQSDCTQQCKPHACGDEIVAALEECDDGNLRAGDGCDASCRAEAAPVWTSTFDAFGVDTGQLLRVGP